LSRYTAFLCLEDTSYYCKDCLDETQTVHTEDLVASDSLLTAYPNPFSSQVTIQINAEFSKQEHPTFEVYDLKGQLVHYFTLSTGVNEQKIDWDGRSMSGDQIPAGVYIGLMKLKDRTVVIKLVKV
jgi:flagellar hook assembly protein FlgD